MTTLFIVEEKLILGTRALFIHTQCLECSWLQEIEFKDGLIMIRLKKVDCVAIWTRPLVDALRARRFCS